MGKCFGKILIRLLCLSIPLVSLGFIGSYVLFMVSPQSSGPVRNRPVPGYICLDNSLPDDGKN